MKNLPMSEQKSFWLVIFIAILAIIWVINSLVKIFTPGFPTPIQHYTVGSESSQFQKVWSLDNMYESDFSATRPMILTASNNAVFFLGYSDQHTHKSLIMKLEPLTGQVVETISVDKDAQAIASDEKFLYIGVGSDGKILSDDLKGAAQIIAYDILSGTQIWDQQIRGAREILSITPQKTRIFVTTSYSVNEFHYLDASSGYIISSNNESNLSFGSIYFPPILADGIYVGQWGPRTSSVYGLDSATGNLLWETDAIAYGNVAVYNEFAYFLTSQAQLLALDVHTGQIIASVQLVPDNPQDQLSQRYLVPFDVVVSNDIVVVYMGDSFQLFAFRFLP